MNESSLCKNYRVLEFDDKAAGGHQGISEDGSPYLKGVPKGPTDGTWDLKLPFNVRDVFPTPSHLTQSALGGCGFCGLLQESILWDPALKHVAGDISESVDIEICLKYRWAKTAPGLILIAEVKPLNSPVIIRISFRVKSLE
ncbi:hypothetical protein QBC38DRAFT_523192, partial [Podospora fimiseda]